MNTPRKAGNVTNEDSAVNTPFRERALEEQRLKNELLLSATPGLKRNSEFLNDSERIGNDPKELKSYLKDLSAVLVSQDKKNLTDVLYREENLPVVDDDARDSHTDTFTQGSRSGYALRDAVFSQLQSPELRTKGRRVQSPIIIEDAGPPLSDGEISLDQEVGGADSTHNISGTEWMINDEMDAATATKPDRKVEVQELRSGMDRPISKTGQSDDMEMSDQSSSSVDSDPDEVEPMPINQIKQSLRLFMRKEHMWFSKQSWEALQNVSESLIAQIGKELTDEEKRLIPDRQNILKAYRGLKVIPQDSTNEALFEVCCNYLTLEDLNKLEGALFL